MIKEAKTDECMVCQKAAKFRLGLPGNRAHLCGAHREQLKNRVPPLTNLFTLSRRQIRAAFGFEFLDE